MNSDINQQLAELVKHNQSFAIVLKEQWTTDDLAAATAWQLFLKAENKNVTIYCSGRKPESKYDFLNIGDIRPELHGKKYQINVDVSQSGVNELSYSVENNTLKIFILPDKGTISEKDIHLEPLNSSINVIICIGVDELAKTGKIFNQQSELFYNLPTINIDYQPENIRYGTINLIDITAGSNCEISFDTISRLNEKTLAEEIATALLTGIIDSSQSFLRGKVSPKSLKIAGQLLEAGAKRDKIVGHLYQTKTVEQLRLWGRALNELKELAGGKLLITRLDDQNNEIDLNKISGIVNELLINSPLTKVAALIVKQKEQKHLVILASVKSYDILKLLNKNETVNGQPFIICESDEQVNEMIDKITSYLEQF